MGGDMARHDPERYRADDPEWQGVLSARGVERLEAYCEQLNRNDWIANSGKLYYVASRAKADGTTEHFVERHI